MTHGFGDDGQKRGGDDKQYVEMNKLVVNVQKMLVIKKVVERRSTTG